ncbi:MAG: FecR domain-containing protein [Candidatus Aminicenantales bacterium]
MLAFVFSNVFMAGQEKSTFKPPNHCLFPLEQGAQWNYRLKSPEISGTSTWSIESVSAAPGSKTAIISRVISIAGMNNEVKSELSLRQNRVFEKLTDVSPASPTAIIDVDMAGLLLPDLARLHSGYSWEVGASIRMNLGIADSRAGTRLFYRVLGWEWVTVPAGTFYSLKFLCRYSRLTGDVVVKIPKTPPKVIDLDQSIPGDSFEWYAPFVGLVKSHDTAPEGGGTWELLSCNLAPQPFDTAVISLSGTASINDRVPPCDTAAHSPRGTAAGKERLPEAEIIHAEAIDIKTGQDSMLELYQANGNLMRIGPATHICLNSPCTVEKKPKPVMKSVVLFLGRLYLHLNRAFGPREFRCDTPTAVTGSRGTKFMLEVRPDGSTLVEVEEGEVEVTEKKTGHVFLLKKGEKREFYL